MYIADADLENGPNANSARDDYESYQAEMYAENAWLRYAERPDADADRELDAEAQDEGLQLLRDTARLDAEWDAYHAWLAAAAAGNDWEWGEVS